MHGSQIGMSRTREPNGRLQRERELPAAQVRRLRDAALAGLRQPEWGTELGRLLLTHVIDETQYAAGRRWADHAAKYRGVIGIRSLRSPSAEPGIAGQSPDPDSMEGERLAKREREAMERFYQAHVALTLAGMLAERAVRKVCEDNEALCGIAERQSFIHGLNRLVTHYNLTTKGKSDVR